MIYIFSQPLFYCLATEENPQVHRPYGVLCALKLQKGLSIRCPPQSRLRRQPAIPALMYLIYQEAR